jgi:hypothetical protein
MMAGFLGQWALRGYGVRAVGQMETPERLRGPGFLGPVWGNNAQSAGLARVTASGKSNRSIEVARWHKG